MSDLRFKVGGYFRRNSVNIGVLIIVFVLGMILFVEAIAANNIQQQQQKDNVILGQLKGIVTQINSSSKQRTIQLTDLQNHIDCIVELFQQPSRNNLTINDLQGCQIIKNSVTDGQQSNSSVQSTPPQSSNSGAVAPKSTTSGGVTNTTQPSTPTPSASTTLPVNNNSALDKLPVVGGVLKKLGL